MVKANGNVNDDKDNYDDNDGSKGDTIVTIWIMTNCSYSRTSRKQPPEMPCLDGRLRERGQILPPKTFKGRFF